MSDPHAYDVAIIGGGPAGSTTACILRKYAPGLRVAILEKERFPREHIGESQLPAIGGYLAEMGCWEKVEAANFPIKVGATYRWGSSPDLWDFEFLTLSRLPVGPRPHRFEGPRQQTAFQVERAVYDKILLDHTREMGAEVFEGVQVTRVDKEGDRVTGLSTSDGREITARYYVDASGHAGVLRRAMGVPTTVPTSLMNIAIWDYWTDAEWAFSIGAGGTRIQIMSLSNGWIWFIPISPTRTSIGFICLADYYKRCGKSPETLYTEALAAERRCSHLIRNARREGRVRTTKDWSFISERLVGENWFLAGEAAGFADPILSGGMTLAHGSGHNAAYVMMELDRGELDSVWLKKQYDEIHRRRVLQYIRFADFWYAANGQFTDLRDLASKIADDAGFSLTPRAAFRWLSLGGFGIEDFFQPGLGGLDLIAVREIAGRLTDPIDADWLVNRYNTFKLNLLGAEKRQLPVFKQGRIYQVDGYTRAGRTFPLTGVYAQVVEVLRHASYIGDIAQALVNAAEVSRSGPAPFNAFHGMSVLESMLIEGWVTGKRDETRKMLRYLPFGPDGRGNFHDNEDAINEIIANSASNGTPGT